MRILEGGGGWCDTMGGKAGGSRGGRRHSRAVRNMKYVRFRSWVKWEPKNENLDFRRVLLTRLRLASVFNNGCMRSWYERASARIVCLVRDGAPSRK